MFHLPEKCLRGGSSCTPLAQIAAEGDVSFFCCGENDGSCRPIDQDKYTLCFKGQYRDDISYNDKRDLIHNAAVLMQALAIIEEDDCSEYHASA